VHEVPGQRKKDELEGKPPLFIVHGVGAGLISYSLFVSRLRQRDPDRTIVCVTLPHVSMKLEEHVPSADQVVKTMDKIYRKMGIEKASWVGHSLGTTWVSWMCKKRPEMVQQSIFIDPVCFALWEGSVANNFVYRNPLFATVTDVLMYYFASKELFISHTLSRHFVWFDNEIFQEQVDKANTHVFVSEKDTIIDPKHTIKYLKQHSIPHTLMKGLHHAQIFTDDIWEKVVINSIR
jgi:pimeloyl-ACP methyl ester carboxylesterase